MPSDEAPLKGVSFKVTHKHMNETMEHQSPIVTSKLLTALGRSRELSSVGGKIFSLPVYAHLWGVELTDAVEAISNHVS